MKKAVVAPVDVRARGMRVVARRILVGAGLICAALAGSGASAQSALFRFDDLDLRDPHVYVSAIGTCWDVTSTGVFGVPSINSEIEDGIRNDRDGDGLLDQSTVIEFLPLDRNLALNLMEAGTADCTAPIATTACSEITTSILAGDAALSTVSTCLAPEPGSVVHAYTPAITSANAPCFASPADSIAVDFGGIQIQLSDAQLAARFVDDPATGLDNGLLRGFLSETDAANTTIPAEFPVVGGQALSLLLPGGQGNCATHDDRDTHNGVTGWWFYFNFTAPRIEASPDPFAGGFADGFES